MVEPWCLGFELARRRLREGELVGPADGKGGLAVVLG